MQVIDLRSTVKTAFEVEDPAEVFIDALPGCLLAVVLRHGDEQKRLKVDESPKQLPADWFHGPGDYVSVERVYTPAANEVPAYVRRAPLPAQQGIGDMIRRRYQRG